MNYSIKYKNGKKYYRCHWYENGKEYDLTALTKAKLNEKVEKTKQRIREGLLLNDQNITVEAWAGIWLETYKKPMIVEKSYNNYKTIINTYILPVIGNYRMCDVQHAALQNILNTNSKSRSYMEKIKNAITGMFAQAKMNRIIGFNPAEGLKVPASTVKGKRRCLTKTEEAAFLKVCENHYASMFGLLMYYCGLRPGECSALLWEDVDLENKIIHITKATESGQRNKIKNPKTDAGIRDIPIPDVFLPILEKNKGTGIVLRVPSTGGPTNDDTLVRWFRNIVRCMNIEMGAELYRNKIVKPIVDDITAYCIRHTYCTNLQRAGVPLNVAKYLMGHEDIKITASIYTHQTDDQTENAQNYINKFYSKTENNPGDQSGD